MKISSGFTFVEVQVAVIILLISVMGTALLIINDIKHLQWLERRRQLYSVVPSTESAIFTEFTSQFSPSKASVRVFPFEFVIHISSMEAAVHLKER